jgi:hypothetical protein
MASLIVRTTQEYRRNMLSHEREGSLITRLRSCHYQPYCGIILWQVKHHHLVTLSRPVDGVNQLHVLGCNPVAPQSAVVSRFSQLPLFRDSKIPLLFPFVASNKSCCRSTACWQVSAGATLVLRGVARIARPVNAEFRLRSRFSCHFRFVRPPPMPSLHAADVTL